ncbi:LysR family transcriptional regulator [Anaerococcus sp.]|uniref:LysR family transcriptional regulator n=1 Tax=Anaerococcus sp. TaxID=1872515 RepID=UPI0027BB06D0|nr:LysR family transcriptional regulator [Anaerococcus sp.]
MNQEHIETFLSVVMCGNITSAAKKLYVSQSTVSSRIQQLEEEIGAHLIIRKKGQRNIVVTPYGSSFISIANRWLALQRETKNLKNRADIKTLNIASVDAVNNYTFVLLFQNHLDKFPNIRLCINTHHSGEIYDLIANRSSDIGFVFSQISHPDVISIPIYRELMYLVCHKDSPYNNNQMCKDLKIENEVYLNWGLDYYQWHTYHWNPDDYPLIQVNTGSLLQRYLNVPGRWAVAPMSVINAAMNSNKNLTYYTLNEPPSPRICYEIKSRYMNINQQESIETIEAEIKEFIKEDNNICSFESWMLN